MLRHLRALMALADTGILTRAGTARGLSQVPTCRAYG